MRRRRRCAQPIIPHVRTEHCALTYVDVQFDKATAYRAASRPVGRSVAGVRRPATKIYRNSTVTMGADDAAGFARYGRVADRGGKAIDLWPNESPQTSRSHKLDDFLELRNITGNKTLWVRGLVCFLRTSVEPMTGKTTPELFGRASCMVPPRYWRRRLAVNLVLDSNPNVATQRRSWPGGPGVRTPLSCPVGSMQNVKIRWGFYL